MMNTKEVLIFVGGVAVGSAVTFFIAKKKYQDQLQNAYVKINQDAIDKAAAARNKPDISVYTKVLEESEARKIDYTKFSSTPVVEESKPTEPPVEEVEEDDEEYLYEISKEAFASYTNDNTRINITRYADDIFADEMYDKIDPREYLSKRLITLDAGGPVDTIDYIRKMAQDEIIIRDNELKLDIDIDTNDRTYSDYMST